MINTKAPCPPTRCGGFILITALVFLAVITLLTLHSVQLATQDLLLAGNVQQHSLAQQAALREAARLRAQLASAANPGTPPSTSFYPAGVSTWIGCFESPWVPLEGPASAPVAAYNIYRVQSAAAGPGSSTAQLEAVFTFPAPPGTCITN